MGDEMLNNAVHDWLNNVTKPKRSFPSPGFIFLFTVAAATLHRGGWPGPRGNLIGRGPKDELWGRREGTFCAALAGNWNAGEPLEGMLSCASHWFTRYPGKQTSFLCWFRPSGLPGVANILQNFTHTQTGDQTSIKTPDWEIMNTHTLQRPC